MKKDKGFTLIELMVVTAIIGILASVSLPAYQDYIHRAEIVEAMSLSSTIQRAVREHYEDRLTFPKGNEQAGVPEPRHLIGNRVSRIEVESGAVHVTLGNKVTPNLQGRVLSFRPVWVSESPESPISWVCGYDEPVEGMEAAGENRTDLDKKHLPSACRG